MIQIGTSMIRNDEAQGLLEYALMIPFVAIVAIAALHFLGSKPNNMLSAAASQLS
jgi:hypothetical protein